MFILDPLAEMHGTYGSKVIRREVTGLVAWIIITPSPASTDTIECLGSRILRDEHVSSKSSEEKVGGGGLCAPVSQAMEEPRRKRGNGKKAYLY